MIINATINPAVTDRVKVPARLRYTTISGNLADGDIPPRRGLQVLEGGHRSGCQKRDRKDLVNPE